MPEKIPSAQPEQIESKKELNKNFFKTELSPNDKESLKKLAEQLENFMDKEAAEQLIFILKMMATEDYVNQCRLATKALAEKMNERFGGEESFFDLMPPKTRLFDLRSNEGLSKINYQSPSGHSVAGLDFFDNRSASKNKKRFIIIDPVYGVVNRKVDRDNILLLAGFGNIEEAKKALSEVYGGRWQEAYFFDRKNNKFIFIDKDKK